MNLLIGSDHAGYELKEKIKSHFKDIDFVDKGCYSMESVDYPDFAHAVSQGILDRESDFGILVCGTANGVSIAANKHKGIRAGIAWQPELASLTRQHNNANILSLPARFISESMAYEIVEAFLSSEFEGGRHQNRVEKIDC